MNRNFSIYVTSTLFIFACMFVSVSCVDTKLKNIYKNYNTLLLRQNTEQLSLFNVVEYAKHVRRNEMSEQEESILNCLFDGGGLRQLYLTEEVDRVKALWSEKLSSKLSSDDIGKYAEESVAKFSKYTDILVKKEDRWRGIFAKIWLVVDVVCTLSVFFDVTADVLQIKTVGTIRELNTVIDIASDTVHIAGDRVSESYDHMTRTLFYAVKQSNDYCSSYLGNVSASTMNNNFKPGISDTMVNVYTNIDIRLTRMNNTAVNLNTRVNEISDYLSRLVSEAEGIVGANFSNQLSAATGLMQEFGGKVDDVNDSITEYNTIYKELRDNITESIDGFRQQDEYVRNFTRSVNQFSSYLNRENMTNNVENLTVTSNVMYEKFTNTTENMINVMKLFANSDMANELSANIVGNATELYEQLQFAYGNVSEMQKLDYGEKLSLVDSCINDAFVESLVASVQDNAAIYNSILDLYLHAMGLRKFVSVDLKNYAVYGYVVMNDLLNNSGNVLASLNGTSSSLQHDIDDVARVVDDVDSSVKSVVGSLSVINASVNTLKDGLRSNVDVTINNIDKNISKFISDVDNYNTDDIKQTAITRCEDIMADDPGVCGALRSI